MGMIDPTISDTKMIVIRGVGIKREVRPKIAGFFNFPGHYEIGRDKTGRMFGNKGRINSA